jgi:hypothetical protein
MCTLMAPRVDVALLSPSLLLKSSRYLQQNQQQAAKQNMVRLHAA